MVFVDLESFWEFDFLVIDSDISEEEFVPEEFLFPQSLGLTASFRGSVLCLVIKSAHRNIRCTDVAPLVKLPVSRCSFWSSDGRFLHLLLRIRPRPVTLLKSLWKTG